MNNVYELRVEIDPTKYSERYQRIGRAETILTALHRALNQAHAELRIAKKEQRFSNRGEVAR
jgi:hypothetical protein